MVDYYLTKVNSKYIHLINSNYVGAKLQINMWMEALGNQLGYLFMMMLYGSKVFLTNVQAIKWEKKILS